MDNEAIGRLNRWWSWLYETYDQPTDEQIEEIMIEWERGEEPPESKE